MAFGSFDYFHDGHESYLKQAKELGEYLVVVIARDKTIKQIKGRSAVHPERERAKAVRESGIADKVILGYLGDKYKVIREFRPEVIALGYDQIVFTQKLEKALIDLKLNTIIHRLQPYFPQVYKSSLIRKKTEEMKEKSMETASSLPS